MKNTLQKALWNQFGASIDMLENAILACPDALWDGQGNFWYNAYHCLFFLDYYLTPDPVHFVPPPPFSESEFEDRMPDRVYRKVELLHYLQLCREKCRGLISGLTPAAAARRWRNSSGSMDFSLLEITLYNMRHVQHHAAQLNLLLRQGIDDAPDWVRQAQTQI